MDNDIELTGTLQPIGNVSVKSFGLVQSCQIGVKSQHISCMDIFKPLWQDIIMLFKHPELYFNTISSMQCSSQFNKLGCGVCGCGGHSCGAYNTTLHVDYRITNIFLTCPCITYTLYSTCVDLYPGKKANLFEYAEGQPPGQNLTLQGVARI